MKGQECIQMPTQSAMAKAHRQKAAEAFGRMIRRWRELNGWSQYVAEKWAQAADFCCLSHSGLSPLETGKNPHPRGQMFAHFAEMNRRLAVQDFSGVKDQALKARLDGAQPMRDDDGVLLEEEQLVGIHLGIRRVPAYLWVSEPEAPPLLSEEEATALCEIWRSLVRDECSRRGDHLIRGLNSLSDAVPAARLLQLQDVLMGETTYTPEQLQQLWDGAQWLPQQWLESWTAGPKRLMPAGGGGLVATATNW